MFVHKELFENDWGEVLNDEFEKPYYSKLRDFLEKEYEEQVIYPRKDELWTAFKLTSFNEVKVVILGQDPYHGPGQAHGLSFSVKPGVKIPPSLRNMFKELVSDIGCPLPENGTLTGWAQQGVLMLNTVLTVRDGQAHSHRKKGWETFTDEVIRKLSNRDEPIVFVLWGAPHRKRRNSSMYRVMQSLNRFIRAH